MTLNNYVCLLCGEKDYSKNMLQICYKTGKQIYGHINF